uniref:legumain n=1 Tax=Steinernema glaseri TaxID=37863 RepID=A0A1I8ANG3_9BILA
MTRLGCLLAFAALLGTTCAADEGSTKWALLIAGSNGYYNYRHQADVSHAYQLLRKRGIPEENIVTMMYDDIANSPANPYPGKLFNCPKLVDVYAGVKIDYKGDDVNAQVFLDVMTGNKAAVKGKGTGRVIESDADDHVFIYYTDHGATGIVGMPAGNPLTIHQLWNALDNMHQQKRYAKLVFYLEACESGSMFAGFPADRNVYVMTAANPDESSWAVYCNQGRLPCLGDEFSVNWMEDTEAVSLFRK